MADKKRGPGRPPGSKNKKTIDKEAKEAKARQQKKAEAAVKKKGSESKAREKAQEIQAQKKADRRVIDEIWAIIVIAIGAFFIVSIFTTGAGQVGSAISDFLKGTFGLVAYGLPFFLILLGILLFARQTVSISIKSALLTMLLFSMISTMNAVRFIEPEKISFTKEILKAFYTDGTLLHSGGFIGMLFGSVFIKFFGVYGCWIITIVITLICILLIINTPVSRFFKKIGEKIEERKLIKENAILDLEEEEEKEKANDEARAAFISAQSQPVFTKREELKEEIKIIGAKEHFENSDQEISKEEKAKFEAEKRKKNILSFVTDDSLFGGSEYSGTYGLEEKPVTERGKGLDLNNDGKIDGEDIEYGIKTYSDEAEKHPSPRAKAYMDDYQIGVSGVGHGMGFSKDDDNIYETPEKLTNKEAREAMLKNSDINKQAVLKNYKKPPLNLLKKPETGNKSSVSALKAKAEKLESTLRSFNVDAKVIQVIQGPTVTRYEIQPSVGVKVSKIVNLADDIALNLEAKSIRIEAPIPGKAAVGIEIENDAINMVRVSEIIGSSEFKEAKSKISFAVGKDIGGKAIVADLKSMPHLLIAGATGSGKSVCINTIITSLMYKSKPDEVKLILIDPKVVELGNYNGIPHLMIPVVTDASKAAASLNWAVSEMTDRYKKFAECGVRDLESYNEWVVANDEKDKVLPQVVIIIDELADLMMAAPSQIEDSICRLAQMARAAGMHLIVATQRPSVDVITGVIKANIPSRIAFAVSSHVDSMTILDMKGAESLVGKGDMLFYPMGNSKPMRVQGAFISDQEVSSVIEFVKGQVDGGIDYNEEILARIERSDCQSSEEETDDLLMDCMELVVNQGQASVSMLQRRFRIGYNRAARIMDIMEDKGIVGPQDGSRPRQVLLTESEFMEIKQEAMESE